VSDDPELGAVVVAEDDLRRRIVELGKEIAVE